MENGGFNMKWCNLCYDWRPSGITCSVCGVSLCGVLVPTCTVEQAKEAKEGKEDGN